MADKYTHAAKEAHRFFHRVSAEAVGINAKIIGYAARLGTITKQRNPTEFDSIMKDSAADLEVFGQRIEGLLPEYRRNLDLLTEGFEERATSLDPLTQEGAQELQDLKREAQNLAETARGVQPKINALRDQLTIIRDSNHDPRLTAAAHKVIAAANALLAGYDDLETFALRVSFAADRK